ncbi:MAG: hypothetical protein AAGJ81_05710 [Verrucomicrobiota bacterium]
MADDEKTTEETPKPAVKAPALTPKLPPKKPGSALPNLGDLKAKKPPAPLPAKSDAGDAEGDPEPVASDGLPKLAPKTEKPKLTPKIPSKPEPVEEKTVENASPAPAPVRPMPPKPPVKTPPPKPHVVQPGAARVKSQPTQGGAAVSVDTGKKRHSGVSSVALALDILACVGALAVGYLILNDFFTVL